MTLNLEPDYWVLPPEAREDSKEECTAHVMHSKPCTPCGIKAEDICRGCGTYECFDTWRCS